MLRSDLCPYSNAYVKRPNNTDEYDKKLAFRNNAPLISCISNINITLIDNI